jgi:hypothetical protein
VPSPCYMSSISCVMGALYSFTCRSVLYPDSDLVHNSTYTPVCGLDSREEAEICTMRSLHS